MKSTHRIRRWGLHVLRNLLWWADEWIHAQEQLLQRRMLRPSLAAALYDRQTSAARERARRKSSPFAPGPCRSCGERLEPIAVNPGAVRPHFRCTGCRKVFSMDKLFTLTVCRNRARHVESLPYRQVRTW